MIGVMTVRKKQKSLVELEKPANYDETILLMQVTYRPYKRASNFRGSSSLELTQSTSKWNQSHTRLNGSIYLLLIVSLSNLLANASKVTM
jgi:hypothetical protein